jgi:nucleoside-diphosphate-sugar epimerase
MTRRALVTGSAGFIGRHMVQALRATGYEVLGIDTAPGDRLGEVRLDARDYFRSKRFTDWDLVVHAAAVIGGRAGIDGNPLGMAENLVLDAALFRWAAKAGPVRVVYLSSSSVYPVWLQDRPGHRLTEGDVNPAALSWPDAVYGWTKLTGEMLADHLRDAGVGVTVVRPFSGYGSDQDECYPFRAFVERAKRREDPFTIWGSAHQVRDWVHVDDVCAAILACVELGHNGPLNIGTGVATSMADLAALVCGEAGYLPEARVDPDAPMGVLYRVCQPDLINSVCRPIVDLDEGIRRAFR